MAIKLIQAPTVEPVTLAEIKDYLRVDGNDFDNMLNSLIVAAREYCEAFQNRSLVTQTWEMILDGFPKMPLELPKPPLQSVVSITYKDKDWIETTINPDDYIVDQYSEPGRVMLASGKSFPSVELQPINAVKIRFTAGYGDADDVPEAVKQAMKIFIAHRYENPDADKVPTVVQLLLWSNRMVPL
jgi:uncharacterized phiE125 gp8 family phage protein